MKVKLFTLAVIASLFSCAESKTTESESKDIQSDLEAGAMYLYWVDGDQIKQGECDSVLGHDVILRSFCQTNIKSMNYENFKTSVDNGLSDTITDLESQIRGLERAYEEVSDALNDVLETLAEKEEELAAAGVDLTETRAEIEDMEDIVMGYREQLAWIEEQLSKLPDEDLEAQAAEIAEELEDFRVYLGTLYLKVPELINRISELNSEIHVLESRVHTLTKTLSEISTQIEVTNEALTQARADFADYEDTMDRLEQRVVYRVHDRNDWFESTRPFVRRFAAAFSAKSS